MKSLYLHIPFCNWVCHYCDFAKTAHHNAQTHHNYLNWLGTELNEWLTTYEPQLDTVFFGGGTPSLMGREYEAIMAQMRPYLQPGAEVSLEANPDDINADALTCWQELGFNRLSMGVQTFDADGLAFLTRQHSGPGAMAAIQCAMEKFANVNVDLIYGWPGQNAASWANDLATVDQLAVPHLSLYCLTFEPQTVIGRRQRRGLVTTASDDVLFDRYQDARGQLAEAGYTHEEVSNWAKPGFSCRHNWAYWTDQYFIGVGAGAHGYLPDKEGVIGRRYSYPRHSKALAEGGLPEFEARTKEQWLFEYLGSSLRTARGTSLQRIDAIAQRTLQPSVLLQSGIDQGLVVIKDGSITLDPEEWFREAAWASIIEGCLKYS